MLSSSELSHTTLVNIPRNQAQEFMGIYEHLGDVGLGVWHWGLKHNDKLLGVVSYGTTCFSKNRGWISQLAKELRCNIIQLCRGGCSFNAPICTATHLIARANRAMYNKLGSSIIIAYADTQFYEIGTIYQASNAIYTGLTDPKGQGNYYILGKKMSGWKVRKKFGTRDLSKLREYDPKLKFIPLTPKHRYIMIAATPRTVKKYRKLMLAHNQPYPKREKLCVMSMRSSCISNF